MCQFLKTADDIMELIIESTLQIRIELLEGRVLHWRFLEYVSGLVSLYRRNFVKGEAVIPMNDPSTLNLKLRKSFRVI